MTDSVQGKAVTPIFAGGGEMGELMRSLDWSQTPVGSVQFWSQSLKSLVKTLLTSRYPMVLTWGAEFTQFYNDAYSQLIGDKHPAALGTDIRETLAEAWDTLGPMIQRVMATGVANWTEALPLVLERTGYREESYFSVSHAPAEDDEGQIVGMLAVCSEVTQQVLGERRLQLLRDLAAQTGETRSVQDTCQDLITAIAAHPLDVPFALLYLRELDGRTLALQGTVGFAADEQLCPHLIDVATSHPLWPFALAAVGETILVEALDHQMTVPGGLWDEPVHTALMMPISSSGQTAPLGVLVAGVNPNRALDDGYRSFYELLVGQVSVSIRNAQAYEEERRHAEMLAELDRAKTAFFANVSHEFRTPLTLMLNPLEEVLQSNRLPLAEREQITIAQRNAQRLLKLVNTLLDFSRIEAGRTQAHFEPTDLATYTVELASLFQSALDQAGLRLIVDCPLLPQPISVDRNMWEKIVLNLLSNAFKFTFEGEITVSLHLVGNQVELMVRDTGTSIPAADLPRLFERFHRVEGAQGRTFEGTGIGLSLVQELVHLHGGTIAVESTLGQGSTFRVQLPMHEALSSVSDRPPARQAQSTDSATSYVQEASGWLPTESAEVKVLSAETGEIDQGLEAENQQDSNTQYPVPSTQHSSSARIFLVDDNADMRNYLHRILSEFYQVEVFTEGSAALSAARASTPDLVLSDVMMPGMDGFELLRQLRGDPPTREIPILLLSARAGEEAAVEGLNAGADDYLVKPFSARELLARVAVNVELGRSRQAAARRRLDQALSSVSDFIYTFDLAGRFTYVNQPLLGLWQKSFDQAINKNFFDLDYPPELADRLQRQIQQVIITRQPLKDEMLYTSAFGTRAYEYIFVPLLDSEGAVEAVAGTGRDISDRKQAEQALAEDLSDMQRLHDLSTRLILEGNIQVLFDEILTTAISIMKADAGTIQLLDTQTNELIFLAAQGLKPTLTNCFQSVSANSNTSCGIALANRVRMFVDFDSGVPDPDGSLKIHLNAGLRSAQSTPLISRSGRAIGMLSTHWRNHHRPTERELRFLDLLIRQAADLIERRQTEAALRNSEELKQSILESSKDCIKVLTLDSEIVYVNTGGLRLLGVDDPTFVLNTRWLDFWQGEDYENAKQAIAAAKAGNTGQFQGYLPTREGTPKWWDMIITPVQNSAGQITQLVAVSRDITKQKQAEAEREQLLQREQVARETAETANRTKDEFLAVLSHELRSPLNPILGWSKLLRNGKLDATRTTYALETIERNAQLQVQLIDDLLDISRILRGKLALTIALVDLSFVISAALETVRLAAEAKSLQIQTIISPIMGSVNGDVGRLQQVIWNLLSNAVKFTPVGGRITIELSSVGTNAQIQVKDTGKGIKPHFLPYIFEHFRQEDGATTRKFGGLGLGLAIARQIVELHGGTIAADSLSEGQGTTFTVQIPLAPPSSQPPLTKSSSASTGDLNGIHVLVVDDEPDSRDVVAFVLEQARAIVTGVTSGIEALQAIERSIPDLIVSDIGMPEMDGYMLLRQIRMLEQVRHIPAIALTAYAGEFDLQQALQAGFHQHLAKPVEPEVLLQAVVNLCGRNQEARA